VRPFTPIVREAPALTPQVVDRFWSKVERRGPDDCWDWTASRHEFGYGRISISGVIYASHRIAYAIANGEPPTGYLVLHSCDRAACCNPRHLRVGTYEDNLMDRVARGRCNSARGSENPNARLDENSVASMRADRDKGVSINQLAAKYGVSNATAFRVVNRKSWRHV